MKLKAALVMMLLVLTSLLSFSNRCGMTCDGRTMMAATATAVAKAFTCQPGNVDQNMVDEKELAESSPLLRMTIIL